jgi:hypothetical protein
MIHILVPPGRGGVVDFAGRLHAEIGADAARLTPFAKCDTAIQLMTGDSVILQFSGYGFAKRGAPLWLLRELENRRKSIKTLGIFFHELYAFGPPWTSSFWLSPVQRHIARCLAEMSDFWMTNQEASAQWLRRFAGGKPHAVLPVFSSMGEAPKFSPERMQKIVVFGSAGLRQATYNAAGDALFLWARRESLEVHDVGPLIEDAGVSELLRGHQVVQHGRLEANEVSRLLEDAMFGIVAYPVHCVTKSSVFAAYCAHGVCPVWISQNHGQADGLVAGQHYLSGVPSQSVEPAMAMSIGQAAWGWYQPHRVACHVETLKRLMDKPAV